MRSVRGGDRIATAVREETATEIRTYRATDAKANRLAVELNNRRSKRPFSNLPRNWSNPIVGRLPSIGTDWSRSAVFAVARPRADQPIDYSTECP
jgi:hypothetical protein